MKGAVGSNARNITLKQYISSHSLRKKLTSKAASKQKGNFNEDRHVASLAKISKDQLLMQIKLQLRELITCDVRFVGLIKMIDRLVQLLYLQIKQRSSENQILQTIIRQNDSLGSSMHRTVRSFKNSLAEQHNTANTNLNNNNLLAPSTANLRPKQRKSSLQMRQQMRYSNQSDCSIPNINILIATKNDEQDFGKLQTNSSQLDLQRSMQRQDSKKSIQSVISFSEESQMSSHLKVRAVNEEHFFTPQAHSPVQSIIKMSVPPSENYSYQKMGKAGTSRIEQFQHSRPR